MTIQHCPLCGGTHYGSHECPYRCEICGVNTNQCDKSGCPRNARWLSEKEHYQTRNATEEIKTPRTKAQWDKLVSERHDGEVISWRDFVESMTGFACQLERDLVRVTQERDALRKKLEEAYERAAQVANDFDFGLDSQSGLVESIRALKTEGKS